MHVFPHPLEIGDDGEQPVFGLLIGGEVNAFIHDPFLSECGRFKVDPVQAYGLSVDDAQALLAMNASLREAAAVAHRHQGDGALSLHQVAQQLAQQVLREREAALGVQGAHTPDAGQNRVDRPAPR